jgi:hypothetical protein
MDTYSASIRLRTQRTAAAMQVKPRPRGALLAPAHDHPRKLPEVPEADNRASGVAILAIDRETATELAKFTARTCCASERAIFSIFESGIVRTCNAIGTGGGDQYSPFKNKECRFWARSRSSLTRLVTKAFAPAP